MDLNPAACYRAVLARDVRHDGRFFTCVKTTGIYCRPVCPARPPKFHNCTFAPTAAAAQAAGYRPCLRCRPESSPELDAWRGTEATVSRAMKLIEAGALDHDDVAALAERLEIGERQLRRLFTQHIGAAPITVAQTRRVLLAKQLIHQTDLSMIDVALASGFGSVRRFNETFRRLYHRPPSELRQHPAAMSRAAEISILLPYRPPYDWESMIGFLKARAIAGVEAVTRSSYSRVVEIDGTIGSIRVTNSPHLASLKTTVRFSQLDALPSIISRIRRMFDLGAEPNAIAAVLSGDPILAPLVASRPGLRVPGGWDGFEVAVRAVLGQQITVKAATQLATRLVAALGDNVSEERRQKSLTHAFPRPDRFEASTLAQLGMPTARARCLAGVAEAVHADRQFFDTCRNLSSAVDQLRKLAGIGEWTANYIAMRAMGESDAFLAADIGVRRGVARCGKRLTTSQLTDRAERWRPWRAYAMLHLWMADADAAEAQPAEEGTHAAMA